MSALGPPMELHYGSPFTIVGLRLRTSARAVYDCSALTLKIGVRGATRLLEVAMTLVDGDGSDPSWSGTVEPGTTSPSEGYEYVFTDETGRVVLYGPASVVDHTRPSA